MSLTPPKSKVGELQATLHAKAKSAPTYRFYALYDKVYRMDVLCHAYQVSVRPTASLTRLAAAGDKNDQKSRVQWPRSGVLLGQLEHPEDGLLGRHPLGAFCEQNLGVLHRSSWTG